jgi:hypothetical protein
VGVVGVRDAEPFITRVSEAFGISVRLGVVVSSVLDRRYREGGDERGLSESGGGNSEMLEYFKLVLERDERAVSEGGRGKSKMLDCLRFVLDSEERVNSEGGGGKSKMLDCSRFVFDRDERVDPEGGRGKSKTLECLELVLCGDVMDMGVGK